MISLSAEYALRAAACLAAVHPHPQTTQQIAGSTAIPSPYLAKLLSALVRAGLVASHRGLNGGFSLRRPPDQLTLLQIVQVVDPSRRIHTCPLGIKSHGTNLCPLHRRLDDAAAALEELLSESTLADIIETSEPHAACTCASHQGESHD